MPTGQPVRFHSSLKTSGTGSAQRLDDPTAGCGVELLRIMTRIGSLDIVHWSVSNFKTILAYLIWQPTHSSVLAWRIPGTEEPGGLPSMGSHRVGHDWGDLAAAAAAAVIKPCVFFFPFFLFFLYVISHVLSQIIHQHNPVQMSLSPFSNGGSDLYRLKTTTHIFWLSSLGCIKRPLYFH